MKSDSENSFKRKHKHRSFALREDDKTGENFIFAFQHAQNEVKKLIVETTSGVDRARVRKMSTGRSTTHILGRKENSQKNVEWT